MKIENTIYIEASPAVVWEITIDVEKWAEWSPTIESVKRIDTETFGPGSKVRIKQPMQPEAEWTITKFKDLRLFAWETYRRGLHITASHELYPRENGTENKLVVEMSGILTIILWPVFKLAVNRALTDENNGLKKRCESKQAS